MNDAERRLFITRILLMISLGLTLSLVSGLVKAKREMEAEEVVSDVELFLKAARLQELILPEDTIIIREIESGWHNESYRGDIRAISQREWIRQNSRDTSRP